MCALQIEKEKVPCLNFPDHEVLETIEAKNIRSQVFNRASILGNIDRTKMHISKLLIVKILIKFIKPSLNDYSKKE